ncbi:MAG: hypothetical protein E5V42_00970 [Mesorhizobium sp.]|nr:MAG: hypothetical protein E5V42_00970 [Mesorhizobium sp.]
MDISETEDTPIYFSRIIDFGSLATAGARRGVSEMDGRRFGCIAHRRRWRHAVRRLRAHQTPI